MAWTEDAIEQIKSLAEQGCSAGQITREVSGTTRNAVISKCRREGIQLKGDKSGAYNREPGKARSPRPRFKSTEVIQVDHHVTLEQLEKHHCKWPIGDPQSPDFVFCGRHKLEGHPYCAGHCRLAYRVETEDDNPSQPTRPDFRPYGKVHSR